MIFIFKFMTKNKLNVKKSTQLLFQKPDCILEQKKN